MRAGWTMEDNAVWGLLGFGAGSGLNAAGEDMLYLSIECKNEQIDHAGRRRLDIRVPWGWRGGGRLLPVGRTGVTGFRLI